MANNLANYFMGIGAKRLSEVEVKPASSNQHEFNGINRLKTIFGTDKKTFNGKFIFLPDDDEKIVEAEGSLTWYDARKNHPTRTEYRLYYSTNDVIKQISAGDLLIIARRAEDQLLVIVSPASSTSEEQLLWLFGLAHFEDEVIVKDLSGEKQELGYAGEYIIRSLGIEIEEAGPDYLDYMINTFNSGFPATSIFSAFARSTIKKVSEVEDPDQTLLDWMQREEQLFRVFERYFVEKKLKEGFGVDRQDVDDFISFSLSVQNRRKSRAGHAFENHLAVILYTNKIMYSNGKVTELNKRPDFVFPGIKYYHEPGFDSALLTMLGVKTTAKDRWRQVLSEAAKISSKHLITLEPAISSNQTDEMYSEGLQLVIPKNIQSTYNKQQQKKLLTLKEFISLVLEKQNRLLNGSNKIKC